MEEEIKKEKPLLEQFHDRRVKAEAMSEEFRSRPVAFEKFTKILKAETFLRGLQIALKAPRTMNPEKIKDHYNMVKDYIKAFGEVDLPDAEVFMEKLTITNVNSYDQALSPWVFGCLKEKTNELVKLARS